LDRSPTIEGKLDDAQSLLAIVRQVVGASQLFVLPSGPHQMSLPVPASSLAAVMLVRLASLAILGGIFGFGLKRNVIALYSFLCRNYHDGDRLFGFGFSRGAFTIRIVAGLVAREGLVPYGSEAQLARDARAAYRHFRQKFNTNFQIEVPLRWIRNLFYPRPVPPQYRPRIHFVGLWDTVEAYGGPIVEITRAIDYWLWPLSMPDLIMSDQIDRACHALALDDERRAFWPVLWDEFNVVDSQGNLRPNERPAPKIRPARIEIPAIAAQRLVHPSLNVSYR
jgi:uncharacterized protein (DUF2235 family)